MNTTNSLDRARLVLRLCQKSRRLDNELARDPGNVDLKMRLAGVRRRWMRELSKLHNLSNGGRPLVTSGGAL